MGFGLSDGRMQLPGFGDSKLGGDPPNTTTDPQTSRLADLLSPLWGKSKTSDGTPPVSNTTTTQAAAQQEPEVHPPDLQNNFVNAMQQQQQAMTNAQMMKQFQQNAMKQAMTDPQMMNQFQQFVLQQQQPQQQMQPQQMQPQQQQQQMQMQSPQRSTTNNFKAVSPTSTYSTFLNSPTSSSVASSARTRGSVSSNNRRKNATFAPTN